MLKRFLIENKLSLLIALTVTIILLALTVARDPLVIGLIFLGSLLGSIILQLDYVIYAYFLEPEKEYSKSVRGYIKDKDYSGATDYIYFHKNDINDKTLNSALFQIVLGLAMLFVVTSDVSMFIKSLVVSAFVNSIYIMMEEFYANRSDQWFWAFKNKPSKNLFYAYTGGLLLFLAYCLSIF